jgi:hypothetical protein
MNNKDLNVKFIVIKHNGQYYATDNIKGDRYHRSELSIYKFDGKTLEPCYKTSWYKLEDLPKKVTFKTADKAEFSHYKLKSDFKPTDQIPLILKEIDDKSPLKPLYNKVDKIVKGEEVEVEWSYDIIDSLSNLDPNKASFKYPFSNTLLSQLQRERNDTKELYPCMISSEDLYKLIRNKIKREANMDYITITSDYDFCLTVNKHISKKYQKEKIKDIISKKSKAKKYPDNISWTVFEGAPKKYQNYTVVDPIYANNYEELEKKIDNYLENIINKINEPVHLCEKCKGKGFISE